MYCIRMYHCNNSEPKQSIDHSQRLSFNSSEEVKERTEGIQRFDFNSSDVKQRKDCSQIFHFYTSGEVKQPSEIC